MTLLKKVKEEWQPSEKKDLQLNEVFDFPGPYENLIKSGFAILVDEAGNELELPNQKFECPVCFNILTGLMSFSEHIHEHLSKRPKQPVVVEEEKSVSAGDKLQQDVEVELKKQQKADEFKRRMAEGRAKKAAEKAGKGEA